jgi:hypothetical protein
MLPDPGRVCCRLIANQMHAAALTSILVSGDSMLSSRSSMLLGGVVPYAITSGLPAPAAAAAAEPGCKQHAGGCTSRRCFTAAKQAACASSTQQRSKLSVAHCTRSKDCAQRPYPLVFNKLSFTQSTVDTINKSILRLCKGPFEWVREARRCCMF